MKALSRIVEDNPIPLLSEANGDVLAARRVARSLLATSEHLFPDTARPVLVLTAMLLHCAIMNGEAALSSTSSPF